MLYVFAPILLALAALKQFETGNETAGVVYLSTASIVLAIGMASLRIQNAIREIKK